MQFDIDALHMYCLGNAIGYSLTFAEITNSWSISTHSPAPSERIITRERMSPRQAAEDALAMLIKIHSERGTH